jgi:hypothetical protein
MVQQVLQARRDLMGLMAPTAPMETVMGLVDIAVLIPVGTAATQVTDQRVNLEVTGTGVA